MTTGFPLPAKLLHRVVDLPGDRPAIALCPDFELDNWRYKQLAAHLFDWLPDVALRPKERLTLLYEPHKTLALSSRRLFDVDDPSKRGEVGEILLHAACRQEFGTAPFVARLFYKMRSNDSVTSVDVVHVLLNEKTRQLELWLGEAKLYDDVRQARYRALESIKPLWDPDFLAEMKALVGPKIDDGAPYEKELAWLFEQETSLDQIISRIVVPICVAADFDPTKSASSRTPEYLDLVAEEVQATQKYMTDRVPIEVRFVVIFIPMDSKAALEGAVHAKIRSLL